MTKFEINPITGRPARKTRVDSKASRYPFNDMTAGMGFYMAADDPDHHHCRVAASNYNKKFDTNIRCNVTQDGRLQVWMDKSEPKQYSVGNHPTDEQHPTKFEFVAWLNGLATGTAVFIPEAYASRYDEFIGFVSELNKVSNLESIAVIDGQRLKITKG